MVLPPAKDMTMAAIKREFLDIRILRKRSQGPGGQEALVFPIHGLVLDMSERNLYLASNYALSGAGGNLVKPSQKAAGLPAADEKRGAYKLDMREKRRRCNGNP